MCIPSRKTKLFQVFKVAELEYKELITEMMEEVKSQVGTKRQSRD